MLDCASDPVADQKWFYPDNLSSAVSAHHASTGAGRLGHRVFNQFHIIAGSPAITQKRAVFVSDADVPAQFHDFAKRGSAFLMVSHAKPHRSTRQVIYKQLEVLVRIRQRVRDIENKLKNVWGGQLAVF